MFIPTRYLQKADTDKPDIPQNKPTVELLFHATQTQKEAHRKTKPNVTTGNLP
jgi:hypothetical protein